LETAIKGVDTIIQKFGITKILFLKEINTFIQQGRIKLIKMDRLL